MSHRDPNKLFFHDSLMKPFVLWLPKRVKPNHLTILRLVLIPIVLILLYIEIYSVGVPLFIFAAFTDAMDGSLARLRKQITEWGTFYDPVADKILIGSVLLLIVIKHVNPILAIALVIVELGLIFGGWYRRRMGTVGHANVWGKIKMFLEFSGLLLILIALWSGASLFIDLSNGTLILALVFAIASLLTYSL